MKLHDVPSHEIFTDNGRQYTATKDFSNDNSYRKCIPVNSEVLWPRSEWLHVGLDVTLSATGGNAS